MSSQPPQHAFSRYSLRARPGGWTGWHAAAVLVAFTSTLGCAEAELGCLGDSCEGDVRVATWWFDETGRDPPFLTPLRQALEQTTTMVLDPQGSRNKGAHMARVRNALCDNCDTTLAPEPPFDAVLLNNGEDVLGLAACNGGGDAKLLALDDAVRPRWFDTHFRPELIETLSCGSHVYGMPIGIHRINHVVYNRQLLAEAGYPSSADGGPQATGPLTLSFAQLLEAAQTIRTHLDASGKPAAWVFALPTEPDALSLFFIENVMLSASGETPYRDYWAGCPGHEALFAAALAHVQALAPFFTFTSVEAVPTPLQRVIDGNAALYVTGDWIMADAEKHEDLVGSMPFPGTEHSWVYTADVFALPVNGNRSKGMAWLHALSDPERLPNYTKLKHARPARLDVLPPDGVLDSEVNWVRSLPALRLSANVFGDLGRRLKEWASAGFGDTSALVTYAATEYAKLVTERASNPAAPCTGGAPP